MPPSADSAAANFITALDANQVTAVNAEDMLRQVGGGDEVAGAANIIIYLLNHA